MKSKTIERNVSLAVFVCSVNLDTKKEIMTRLHSTLVYLIVISRLMTGLCQTMS